MALVPCPECRRNVSNVASSCPHCGYTFQRSRPAPLDDGVDLTNLDVPAADVEERVSAGEVTESVPASAPAAPSAAIAASPVQARNSRLRQLAVWFQRAAWVVLGLANVGTASGLVLLLGDRLFVNDPDFRVLKFYQFLNVVGWFTTSVVLWMLMMAIGGMIPVFLDIEEHAREISDRGA